MYRVLLALALVLPVSPASGRTLLDASPTSEEPADPRAPTAMVARLTGALELLLPPSDLLGQLIRWQRELRDLVHGAADRIARVVTPAGALIPDLTVLTTAPVPSSDSSWATSGFGWRDDPIRHRRKFHRGADVRARPGTPVVAAGDGVVVFAGRQGGYGNVIHVDHGGGVVTRYAHLRRIEARRHATVTAGQRIGQVGSTGRATGPHLHFEVRLEGRAVDPGMAMTVGELARAIPTAGALAAFVLTPEVQARQESALDPPRASKRRPKGSRPDRPGRVKRARPVS